jgi:hypothetical protein
VKEFDELLTGCFRYRHRLGIISSQRAQARNPQPVTVENTRDNPVPVTATQLVFSQPVPIRTSHGGERRAGRVFTSSNKAVPA